MRRRFIFLASIILLLSAAKFAFSYAQQTTLSSAPVESDIDTCMRNKDYACVMNYLESSLKDNPRCLECYFGIGILNYYLGNYREALSFLERSIEQSYLMEGSKGYNRGLAFFATGIAYNKIKQYGKAEEFLERAIKYFENTRDWQEIFFAKAMLQMIKRNSERVE